MKKLKLLLCCIPIFLCCGMYCSVKPIILPSRKVISQVQSSAGYWLYFRLEDRLATLPQDAIGRSKKGDLVQVLQVKNQFLPTVREQQEYAIIKVDTLTAQEISDLTSSWEDTVIVEEDTTITTKAYRRWTFDVDNLSISKGLDTIKVFFAPIKTRSTLKTSAMLLEYERKCKIIKYQQFVLAPIEKVFNWAIPKLYAAEDVKTINKTGEDFNTIVLWEDAEDGAMTTGTDEVGECFDDDGILKNSTRVDIDGWTNNDATTRIIVRTASGEQHTGTDSTGFQRENTGTSQSFIIRESFTFIKGLDINGGGSGASFGFWLFNGSDITIERCLVWNFPVSVNNILLDSGTDGNVLIKNNVVYNGGDNGIRMAATTAGNEIFNNTLYNNRIGIRIDAANPDSCTISNNASFDNTLAQGDIFQGTFAKTGSTNNCTSDATGDDDNLANGIINKIDTNNFTDPSAPARDFSVKNNSADIYNAGADLSGTVDNDVIGTSRPQDGTYDIGAFELIVVGGATGPGRLPQVVMLNQNKLIKINFLMRCYYGL